MPTEISVFLLSLQAMPLKLTTYYRGSKVLTYRGPTPSIPRSCSESTRKTPGYTPILIVASEDDKPVAKLLAAIRKSIRMFPPGIIKRCEVYGMGEYFDNEADKEAIFSDMLQRLTNEALRDSFLIEFRNLENAMFGYKSFRANQYIAINWLRVRNSLHSVEKVEERFSPSRIRQIKKGLKNGDPSAGKHVPKRRFSVSPRCCATYILPRYGATSPASSSFSISKTN